MSEQMDNLQSNLISGDYDYCHCTDEKAEAEKKLDFLTKGLNSGKAELGF